MSNENLYIAQQDLYRLGSALSSRISRVRQHEITTMNINGIETIVANNNGISLFNLDGLNKSPLTGWVWEIKKGTSFPMGLKLVKRGSFGHYMLVPVRNMPLSQYISLLEQIAIHCNRILKKHA